MFICEVIALGVTFSQIASYVLFFISISGFVIGIFRYNSKKNDDKIKELKKDVGELKKDIERDVEEVKQDIKCDIEEVKQDVKELRESKVGKHEFNTAMNIFKEIKEALMDIQKNLLDIQKSKVGKDDMKQYIDLMKEAGRRHTN